MNIPPPDDRSPVAAAYAMAWQVTTISLEMVIPGLVGLALDRWLHTVVLFTILGFGGGMTLGIWHLIKLANSLGSRKKKRQSDSMKDDPS